MNLAEIFKKTQYGFGAGLASYIGDESSKLKQLSDRQTYDDTLNKSPSIFDLLELDTMSVREKNILIAFYGFDNINTFIKKLPTFIHTELGRAVLVSEVSSTEWKKNMNTNNEVVINMLEELVKSGKATVQRGVRMDGSRFYPEKLTEGAYVVIPKTYGKYYPGEPGTAITVMYHGTKVNNVEIESFSESSTTKRDVSLYYKLIGIGGVRYQESGEDGLCTSDIFTIIKGA